MKNFYEKSIQKNIWQIMHFLKLLLKQQNTNDKGIAWKRISDKSLAICSSFAQNKKIKNEMPANICASRQMADG